MTLPAAKIEAIRNFMTAMQKAQGELRDAPDREQKVGVAHAAMMAAGVSPQDITAFSAQFPGEPIGVTR